MICMATAHPAADSLLDALNLLADRGAALAHEWRFDWSGQIHQAVLALRCLERADGLPPIAAVAGGASSGKSTVFNNLLEGHLVSRVTARGHATRGPILAVHETHRPLIEELLAARVLLPTFAHATVELDDDTSGHPDQIAVVYHTMEPLRDVLLMDTPDFTSDAAAKEGDRLLMLLPWFDRLLVVVDHERWFDRQSISMLRTESVRFGHERMVLFNRTKEGSLGDADRAALERQALRLGATAMVILEFRRGRGFCAFAPGTLSDVIPFVCAPRANRRGALLLAVAAQANRLLNQNDERAARLDELRAGLAAAVRRATPSVWSCLNALMTEPERAQMEVVSRVFRVRQTKRWLAEHARRVEDALRRVPILGAVVRSPRGQSDAADPDPTTRLETATRHFESAGRRLAHELHRTAASSAFWTELDRWTGLHPTGCAFALDDILRAGLRNDLQSFERALDAWNVKVRDECSGLSPHVVGAIGAGVLGIAAVLVMVPGSVAALTLVGAKGAIGAALGKLAAATGAGALAGKHMGRLAEVITEKLIGSPEYSAVQQAASRYRARIANTGDALAAEVLGEAAALVMARGDALLGALETLRDPKGTAS